MYEKASAAHPVRFRSSAIVVRRGAVSAAADLLGQGQGNVNIDLPGGADLPDVDAARCPTAPTWRTTTATASPTSPTPAARARSTATRTDPAARARDPGAAPTTAPGTVPAERRPDHARPRDRGRHRRLRRQAAAATAAAATAGNGGTDAGRRRRARRRRPHRGARRFATPTARPTDTNPGAERRRLRRRPDRRPQLHHRPVRDPALPAADLPGLRHPVRDPLADPRLDQPDRDRASAPTSASPPPAPIGWMQFMPSTWEAYGVDANDDGRKDPYNPVDAICAAARYLQRRRRRDRPAHRDLRLQPRRLVRRRGPPLRRAQYGKLPDDLVGSLTGLTEGAHFPVAADARYADDISEREAAERRAEAGRRRQRRRRDRSPRRPAAASTSTRARAPRSSPSTTASSRRSARPTSSASYIVLQDAYGNRFTYAAARRDLQGLPGAQGARPHRRGLRARLARRRGPDAPRGDPTPRPARTAAPATAEAPARRRATPTTDGSTNTEDARERLFALPERPRNVDERQPLRPARRAARRAACPAYETFKSYFSGVLKFDARHDGPGAARRGLEGRRRHRARPRSARPTSSRRTSTSRSARPAAARRRSTRSRSSTAGSCSSRPRSTAPPARTRSPSRRDVGQILLMSKAQLERRVLADPRLEIYACGREDIADRPDRPPHPRGDRVPRRVAASA